MALFKLLTSMFRWTSSLSTAMVGPILSADTASMDGDQSVANEQ
jgi:hypothetical protein